jgi:hypothetical protein
MVSRVMGRRCLLVGSFPDPVGTVKTRWRYRVHAGRRGARRAYPAISRCHCEVYRPVTSPAPDQGQGELPRVVEVDKRPRKSFHFERGREDADRDQSRPAQRRHHVTQHELTQSGGSQLADRALQVAGEWNQHE